MINIFIALVWGFIFGIELSWSPKFCRFFGHHLEFDHHIMGGGGYWCLRCREIFNNGKKGRKKT